MIQTSRYVRKTFHVDAVQVTAENMSDVAEWCSGDVRTSVDNRGEEKYIKVRVYQPLNERQTKAFVGDWVLHAGTGYKVYKASAFEKSFVEDNTELLTVNEPAKNSV